MTEAGSAAITVGGPADERIADYRRGLDEVRSAGFRIVAMTPSPDAVPIGELPDAVRERPAVLLGAEGTGLSAWALAAADVRAAIPMRRGSGSLNVAAAAAVVFWELCR